MLICEDEWNTKFRYLVQRGYEDHDFFVWDLAHVVAGRNVAHNDGEWREVKRDTLRTPSGPTPTLRCERLSIRSGLPMARKLGSLTSPFAA